MAWGVAVLGTITELFFLNHHIQLQIRFIFMCVTNYSGPDYDSHNCH